MLQSDLIPSLAPFVTPMKLSREKILSRGKYWIIGPVVSQSWALLHSDLVQKSQKVLKHGSCGVGVGSTFAREEAMFHLTFGDLFYPFVFENKLEMIRKHYYKFVENNDNMKSFFESVKG